LHNIPFKLYTITDRALCAPHPLYDILRQLLDAGIPAIQLREKDLSDMEFIKLAEPIAELCRAYSAHLFINSRIEIAADLGEAGVHLPANAPSVGEIRRKVGESRLVGCSVHTLEEAKKRADEGADFITYSPIYLTASKPGYGPAVGVEGLRKVTEMVDIPVFALGGITPGRVSACLAAGAHGVAVMSGVMSPERGVSQAKAYLQELRRCTK
jgi:thiamine-phosphate pyrophosphorylase